MDDVAFAVGVEWMERNCVERLLYRYAQLAEDHRGVLGWAIFVYCLAPPFFARWVRCACGVLTGAGLNFFVFR